jgi:hypothetical protein
MGGKVECDASRLLRNGGTSPEVALPVPPLQNLQHILRVPSLERIRNLNPNVIILHPGPHVCIANPALRIHSLPTGCHTRTGKCATGEYGRKPCC